MSKKSNTLWFILGATAFNILLTLICIALLLVLYATVLSPHLPEEAASWALIVSFIGGIALAFVIYRFILKQVMKKVDFEQHFDPIFGRRRRK